MAKLIRNIPPNFFLDFLSAEEEENLLWDGEDEDDFVLISTIAYFLVGLWRESQIISKKRYPFITTMFLGAISA